MSDYETIIYEPGPVTRVIHNEDEKRNVIGPQFEREFLDAMKRFERDDDAKVAVSLSTGKHFAAGHDIGKLSKKQSWKKGQQLKMTSVEWRKLNDPRKGLNRIVDVTKPLVVGVQGAAVLAGAGFALGHDIIVMGENSYLGFEIFRVSGAGFGALVLAVGYAKAFEFVCTGWNIRPHELYRLGAINKVVPDDQVEAEAMRYAEIMALMPLETLILLKADLKFAMNRLGVKDMNNHSAETNTLVHLAENEIEKEFYSIMKEKGMRAALDLRDKPFEKYGYRRDKATDI